MGLLIQMNKKGTVEDIQRLVFESQFHWNYLHTDFALSSPTYFHVCVRFINQQFSQAFDKFLIVSDS